MLLELFHMEISFFIKIGEDELMQDKFRLIHKVVMYM